MFQPTKGNKILKDHLPEKFMQTSSECVLPDEKEDDYITSQYGELFMLSFHVEAIDDIKCYLTQKSQLSRFLPEDIVGVWRYLFEDGIDNTLFIQTQQEPENENAFINKLEIPDKDFIQLLKVNSEQNANENEAEEHSEGD